MTTRHAAALLDPLRIGNFDVTNRIAMAPMTRARADGATGDPTPVMRTYYEQRATAGLIISEGVVISPTASGYVNVPGIYSDAQIEKWRAVTDAVHARGGRIFAQIWHVGRVSHPDVIGGEQPVAPSALNAHYMAFGPNGPLDTATPRAMDDGDIATVIGQFADAARNAVAAGFDGVQLHAANGYLIHQFLAGSANQRSDRYGGSNENRARFLFDVLDATVAAIGAERVAVRLNPVMDGTAGIVMDDDLAATFDLVIGRLNDYGLAFLELAGLTFGAGGENAGVTRDMAARYRDLYRGVLMVNTALGKDDAQAILAEGLADLVSFGRAFVANPDLVARFAGDLALASPDETSLYQGGVQGYIDYPALA